MATAKKVEIPQPKFKVELTLSQEEAEALQTVCSKIGGDSSRSRRRHFDSIRGALCDLGIRYNGDDVNQTHRSIYFNDSV